MRVCDGTCDTCDCELWTEATVQCNYCMDLVPFSDAIETGERVGPDLIPYTTYLCFECADDIDRYEDEE